MQQFTYAGYTVRYEQLHHGAVPIALAMQCDGNLVLVSRHADAAEGEILSLGEVQLCSDCHTLQRHDEPDKACSCVGEISTGLR